MTRLQLGETSARLASVKTHLNRAAAQLCAANERARCMRSLGYAFMTWNKYCHDERRRRMMEIKAAK